jgi:hypothetical protein
MSASSRIVCFEGVRRQFCRRGVRFPPRSALLVLCAASALAVRLGATTVVPADFAELSRSAGAIVRGRVIETTGRWTSDRRSIETLVALEMEESLKGSLGSPVRFVVPGGVLGRYRRIFVGAPEINVGQRVVVFLAWEGPAIPHLLGLGQGVFHVQADANRGWLVTPPLIAAPSGGTIPIVRGDPARRPMPLAEFQQHVRELAGTPR